MRVRMFMIRSAAAGAVLALAGCTWTGNLFGDRTDYKTAQTRGQPLEVPPDLSQLPPEERFSVPERPTTATASGTAASRGAGGQQTVGGPRPPSSGGAVVPTGTLARIERDGNHRWLAVNMPPEKAWPVLLDFWPSVGLTVERSDPATGIMETAWAENRTNPDLGVIRQTLARFLGSMYSTGEQDRYRARLERTPSGNSEIFITHRGMEEVFTSSAHDRTAWQPRAPDPSLEGEMLQKLLVRFDSNAAKSVAAGTTSPQTRPGVPGTTTAAAGAAAGGAAASTVTAERAFIVKNAEGRSERLDMDDPFDRAWRRIGLALDRGSFTVEDRDRAKGVYFVRYLDPDSEARQKEQQGFFSKLMGRDATVVPAQYRVQLTSAGDAGTVVRVFSNDGKPELSPAGDRILTLLRDQLR